MRARRPSSSPTTARCRTTACRSWSIAARSTWRRHAIPRWRSRRRSRRTAGATACGATAFIRSCTTIRRSTKCLASRPARRACASAAASGEELEVEAGDVAVLPAGTGHQRLASTPDLLVIGAYPPDGHYDLCRGTAAEHARALETIPRVPLPQTDPLFGAERAADQAVALTGASRRLPYSPAAHRRRPPTCPPGANSGTAPIPSM